MHAHRCVFSLSRKNQFSIFSCFLSVIQFQDVCFAYASRPDSDVLKVNKKHTLTLYPYPCWFTIPYFLVRPRLSILGQCNEILKNPHLPKLFSLTFAVDLKQESKNNNDDNNNNNNDDDDDDDDSSTSS